jgi:hypothetical protein
MTPLAKRRFARNEDLGLAPRDFATLRRLATPERIQAFLNAIPANHEHAGETLLSVREVLRRRHAHCMEGAFVAACALWIHGERPLILHLDCDLSDFPHAIAVFRRGRCWGAISKTNGAVLRYRDPVYRTLRELAMSYFHEYYNKRGRRTLRSYSVTYDMRRFDPALWVTNAKSCWAVHDRLADLRHYRLVTGRQVKALSRRDPFEMKVGKVLQYPPPKKRRKPSS